MIQASLKFENYGDQAQSLHFTHIEKEDKLTLDFRTRLKTQTRNRFTSTPFKDL